MDYHAFLMTMHSSLVDLCWHLIRPIVSSLSLQRIALTQPTCLPLDDLRLQLLNNSQICGNINTVNFGAKVATQEGVARLNLQLLVTVCIASWVASTCTASRSAVVSCHRLLPVQNCTQPHPVTVPKHSIQAHHPPRIQPRHATS